MLIDAAPSVFSYHFVFSPAAVPADLDLSGLLFAGFRAEAEAEDFRSDLSPEYAPALRKQVAQNVGTGILSAHRQDFAASLV